MWTWWYFRQDDRLSISRGFKTLLWFGKTIFVVVIRVITVYFNKNISRFAQGLHRSVECFVSHVMFNHITIFEVVLRLVLAVITFVVPIFVASSSFCSTAQLRFPFAFWMLSSFWGGTVVRALASHQCGPGSIPRLCVICGLSFVGSLYSVPRGFYLGTPVFPSPQKPAFGLICINISVSSVPN